jgi:uncharacterized protein (DUF2225 family)
MQYIVSIFLCVILFGLLFVLYKTNTFINKNRYCPNCGTKLLKGKEMEKTDFVRINKTWFYGNAYRIYVCLKCPNCEYKLVMRNSDNGN